MFVIIAAAGKSSRMNGIKKQLLKICNKYILTISIEKFIAFGIKNIVIGALKEDFIAIRNITKNLKADIKIVEGKNTRQNTIINAFLETYKDYSPKDLVLIHDAARPFFSLYDLEKLVDVAQKKRAAILAVPVFDTMKRVYNFNVIKTISRSNIYVSQTPQAFEVLLYEAAARSYLKTDFEVTDDSEMLEKFGVDVSLVVGSKKNFKITTKEDLEYAKFLVEEAGLGRKYV